METLSPSCAARHTLLQLETEYPTQFIDMTTRLEDVVARAGIRTGVVHVQTLHTTTAVVVNEHEPLLLADFESALERLVPAGAGYRHDDALSRTANVIAGERINGHAHCRALLLPSAASLHVVDGTLLRGRWQRVFFLELDGPRERQVSVLVLGAAGR
jgi:secondary thiamine-phosphate synthase enzyme